MEWCIPHFGPLGQTKELIADILREDATARVLIGDDSGNAGSLETKTIRVIPGPRKGFAPNVNQLLQQVAGEWVVLLNNDVRLTAGWFKQLQRTLASVAPRVGLIATLIERPDGTIDSCGDSFSFVLGRALKRGYGTRRLALARRLPLLSVSGAALVVRRSVWHELGGLDEGLGQYYEDVDFGWRLLAAGYQIEECLAAVCIHQESSSFTSETKAFHSARNAIWLVRRHFPHDTKLPCRAALGYSLTLGAIRPTVLKGIRAGLSEAVPVVPTNHMAGPEILKTKSIGRELWLWPRAYRIGFGSPKNR